MSGLCEGRVAIVTGAGRGIGREHALSLARHGAKVVVNDLGGNVDGSGGDLAPAQQVVDEILEMGGEAVANGDNVADWEGAQRMINTAVETFGDLHALVNNAGILRDRVLANMTEEEWDSVINVHLKGTFAPSRWAVAYWRERAKAGEPVSGRIVNTTSVSGIYGNPGQANYGAAKAGNLNSAMALIDRTFPDVEFVETRDADDEVGSTSFLRATLGQLQFDERLAYVQTIKEAQVSNGDPFNNRESMFYRGQMLTRNAVNAVFPCGSGLMWRRSALVDIGGFPTWNLVEDLQSGVEALRRGWHGLYLPIVGAVAQHSPEDLPNVYKQRGTWALDTVRLMLWGDLKGLGVRQRLHFYGMLLDYLHAFAVMVYLPCLALSLLGWTPFQASGLSYLLHIGPVVVATECWLLAVNRPYNDRRGRQRRPYLNLWRARIMWTGLAPIYAKASILAIISGPNRKPVYKVTRKENDYRWHWQQSMPQAIPIMVVSIVAIYALVNDTLPSLVLLSATLYWGALNVALLVGFVSRSWHGLQWVSRVSVRIRRSPSPGNASAG